MHFGVSFVKFFLKGRSKWDMPNLLKLWAFWTFHISLFVNITAMVVNSYTVLYMCMEVIICQSDRSSPER